MAFNNSDHTYEDVLSSFYSYDDKVQNHKQVKVGDLLFIRSRSSLDGIGRIARIDEQRSEKRFIKCPECQTGRVHKRVGLRPTYKCSSGMFLTSH